MRQRRSRSPRTCAPDRRADEAGVTIVELMITSALLLVVLITVFNALDSVSASQAFQSDRSQVLGDMRNVMNKMTRELRQATAVQDIPVATQLILTTSSITYTTSINNTATAVVYTASGTALTRKVGTAAAFTVLKNLDPASLNIFTLRRATSVTGVQWVEIDLVVNPARRPATTLVLQSEINLRNRTSILTGAS